MGGEEQMPDIGTALTTVRWIITIRGEPPQGLGLGTAEGLAAGRA